MRGKRIAWIVAQAAVSRHLLLQVLRVCFAVTCLAWSAESFARIPLYAFTPNASFPPTLSVLSNGTGLVKYQVTNNSQKTHTLQMEPIPGVIQVTSGGGVCSNPFILAGGASCTLVLGIVGRSAVTTGSNSGLPVVCQQGPDGNPSPYQCYRPSQNNTLSLTVVQHNATLTSSRDSLALSVTGLFTGPPASGMARTITLTNQGPDTAFNVTYSVGSPGLPAGSSISSVPSPCGDIAVSGTCVLTITPGATASDAPNDTSAASLDLLVQEGTAEALVVALDILTWGSVYQDGYVFNIVETANPAASITGTTAALGNTVSQQWSPGGAFNNITTDNFNGALNSSNIIATYPSASLSSYLAGICSAYSIDGYSRWYLPAMCEYGSTTACGSPPPNSIQSNLYDLGYGNVGDINFFTSTQASISTAQRNAVFADTIVTVSKGVSAVARCARAF